MPVRPHLTRRVRLAFALAALLCAIFFAAGHPYIRLVGVQEDESQFTTGILQPLVGRKFVGIGGELYPMMIATYAGALKALAYIPIFAVFPPDAPALRMPMLLAGTVTVFLFFLFFRMVMGDFLALLATAMLVVDPLFISHTVLDFGITTVQHLLMAAALPLFVLYHRKRRPHLLAAACFLCGLALWDKTTFVWLIAGWGAGLAVFYRHELLGHLRLRTAAVALFCVLLGASPVIWYTLTERSTAGSGMGGLGGFTAHKPLILWKTLDGSALFGFLTHDPILAEAQAPHSKVERASVWLAIASRGMWRHWLGWASAVSLLLLPFLRPGPERRLAAFSVLAFAVGWVAMLPFAMGGNGSHHTILLWPLPQMFVASVAGAAGRWLPRFRRAIALGLVSPVLLSCALVTNQAYAQLTVFGTSDHWSDAINPLLDWILEERPGAIYSLDWGIEGPLRCLGQGMLPLRDASTLVREALPAGGRVEAIRARLDRPRRIFIYYVDRTRHAPANLAALRSWAEEAALKEELLTEVRDRNGRPVYRVVRFGR